MCKFIEKPGFETIDEKPGYFRYIRRAVFSHFLLSKTLVIAVGSQTNFASIPSALRIAFPVNDGHEDESGVHDELYRLKGLLPWGQKLTRKQCDRIYLDALKAGGISWLKRRLMYRGLRIAVWRSIGWNK